MITITERALKEVKRIIADQHLPEGSALRVGVKGGGCSGFSYTLGFDDKISETDQVFEANGTIRVVCDPKSFLYLNGTELARSIQVLRADLPVILCTAYSQDVDEATAHRLGVRAVLNKPLEVHALLSKVRALIRVPGSDRDVRQG